MIIILSPRGEATVTTDGYLAYNFTHFFMTEIPFLKYSSMFPANT